MRLQDRTALVTGAGSGMGRAIALRFAEEGARVAVNDAVAGDERVTLAAKSEARLTEMLSGQGIQTQWDITQELSDEAWHRMIGVHLHGAIINMSSVAALMGLENVPHYSAAKGGILAFTRAVAREVGSRGIRVNAICPGFIDTPMTAPIPLLTRMAVVSRTPLGRWGEPHEVAATALFLASDDSSFVTGQWLSPNGGLFTG